jgi:enoyl-CoA hydratase/carnithine racemase
MGDATMVPQDVEAVRVSCADRIGVLEIRRPERRNAVDLATADALRAGLARLAADPDCAAVVLLGQGGDLCSGADLKAADPPTPPGTPSARTLLLRDLAASPVPVVAAIDGAAVGFGLGLAAAATFAVAGAGAKLALPEVRHGFFPEQVVPYLAARVAPAAVLRWALTGARFSGTDAAAAGLVTVCADGDAERVATELARALATGPRDVVAAAMRWWHGTTAALAGGTG